MTLWTNCIQLGSYIRLLQYLVIPTTCGKTGGNAFYKYYAIKFPVRSPHLHCRTELDQSLL